LDEYSSSKAERGRIVSSRKNVRSIFFQLFSKEPESVCAEIYFSVVIKVRFWFMRLP